MILQKRFNFLQLKSMTRLVAEKYGDSFAITFNGLPSDEVEYFSTTAVEDFIKMFWWIPVEGEYSELGVETE